ncbi:toluene-4-monooxygenase system B family protein [Pseudonocardia sp. H11422]|uniref:toluene-4-monooxygenase system B family protein n=1 Tax=Pseudonocardia sp. H11422 TaxID=2835866 RepID=UPI001BDCB6A7|nr:toluene-4-monooxygenase system B family protein [Pseudonocardia sp. H11422]
MAPFPVQGIVEGDFVIVLVPVDTEDLMPVVAEKIAHHAVNRRVPERDQPMAVRHNGRLLAPEATGWSQALVQYALAADPGLRDVLGGWVATWSPRADAAVAGLAPLFGGAPVPITADEVTAAVRASRTELLTACGL